MIIFSVFLHYANLPNLNYLFHIEPTLRLTYSSKMHISLSSEKLDALLPYLKELDSLRNAAIELENHCLPINNSLAVKMNSLVLYCLSTICEDITKKEKNTPIQQELIRSIEFIHENYLDPLTIADLAKKSHMSEATYTRVFKKNLNINPSQYILNLKLEHAADLLITTKTSIASIAQTCGFYDSSHFIDKFKRKYHITPKEYRKQNSHTNSSCTADDSRADVS